MNQSNHIGVIAIAACALIVASLLGVLFDSGLLGNDFAQVISVAHNLIQGNGLKTDLIYYDVHYELGGFPVSQTVFPPGHSVLLALLLALGIPVHPAGFALSLGSFVATAVVLSLIVRRLGGSSIATVVAGGAWLIIGVNWASVLLCRSEVLFTLLTVLGLYCFVRWSETDSKARLFLALLGLAAGSAFLIRYQGLFAIAGFGLYFAIRFMARRDSRSLVDLLVFGSVPLLFVVVVFAYNTFVTGGIGGGPVDHAAHSADIFQVAIGFYYEFSRLLGVSRDGLLAFRPGEIFAVVLLAYSTYVLLRYRIFSATWQAVRPVPVAGFCLAYVSVSVAALVFLSLTKSTGYIQARYLSTLLPFVIVLVAISVAQLRRCSVVPRRLDHAGVGLALAFLVVGQAQAISEQLDFVASDSRLREIRVALSVPFEGNTVQQFLQLEIDAGGNLLANQSQLVGHVLERPTFGLTPSLYSSRQFDLEEVSAMADIYNLKYIVLFPALYDPHAVENRNRVILTELLENRSPDWIRSVLQNEKIHLYRIEQYPDGR